MPTPKIIHQIWNNALVPEPFRTYAESVCVHQPDYERRLWTFDDIDAFVHARVPQFAETYSRFRRIERIDFARCVILYEIGGAYFDLDIISLCSIDPLVATGQIVLGLECSEHTQQFRPRPKRIISNALMISPPGEAFWRGLMQDLVDHYHDWRWWWQRGPVYRTGPMALTAYVDRSSAQAQGRLAIMPSCAFFPMSDHWNDGHIVAGFDSISRDCESLDDTYAVHLWSHAWLPPWVQRFNRHKRRILGAMSSVTMTAPSDS